MIFLAAGHSGPNTGAQGVAINNQFIIDEGSETIRLRSCLAQRLSSNYGISVLLDRDSDRLGVVCNQIKTLARTSDIVSIDIHLNASKSIMAHGTEVIVADNATEREISIAVRLLNATANALGTTSRGVKTESETPPRRLAMLHNGCTSVILEICFCTNDNDVAAYQRYFDRLVDCLAATIAKVANY